MDELAIRYQRHLAFDRIGAEGQRRLARGSVLVAGCGALGGAAAALLVRAGVGAVRLVDDDRVEPSNLPRQILYDEADAAAGVAKAPRAAERLRAANSACRIEARVERIDAGTIDALLDGIDVVVDGLDNFATRYVVNDACVRRGVPWIYGGVVGATGVTLTVRPGLGPCLRCVFPEAPPEDAVPTCRTHGVVAPAPVTIAALETVETLKLLLGRDDVRPELLSLDLWDGSFRAVRVARAPACPACGAGPARGTR
ncbi:MAG: HesA/MoeB/ThiF family protein [Myxococcales bacterium]|nr:HesA/MoeB/ThiF family protein [Myxococcales bacterium]